MKRIALLVGITALTAACASSPPSSFYALRSVAPRSAAQGATGSAGGNVRSPVRIAAVHIPPRLDRQEIVRLGPGSRLEIGGLDRWGAPLDEMIQRVLTQDLLGRLPRGRVVLPSGPAPAGTDLIVLDVLEFQSDTSGAVRFEGSWSLLAPGGSAPLAIHDFNYTETASPSGYAAEAAVMSRMLGRLADDIAASLPRR